MKIHLGCGTIYLYGYINVDASPHYLADDPEAAFFLEQNKTTMDQYYKFDFNSGSGKVVADKKALIDNLPFADKSVDEAVIIHVLEHIPAYEVDKTVSEIYRVLKIGGKLVIGVPDIKETAKMLIKAETNEDEDWCIRLIHGTQRDKFSHHFCGYVPRTLKMLLSKHGFTNFKDLPNKNFYPSVYLEAFKG